MEWDKRQNNRISDGWFFHTAFHFSPRTLRNNAGKEEMASKGNSKLGKWQDFFWQFYFEE